MYLIKLNSRDWDESESASQATARLIPPAIPTPAANQNSHLTGQSSLQAFATSARGGENTKLSQRNVINEIIGVGTSSRNDTPIPAVPASSVTRPHDSHAEELPQGMGFDNLNQVK